MTRRILAGLLGAILAITGSVVPAHAEWSIDVYGGASWTETTDLHVRGNDDTGASVNATVFDIGTDTGFTVGIRVGYWLESLPVLGLGFDIFYFSMEVPAQTTTASASFSGEFADRPISVGASGVAQIPRVTLPGLGFSPELRLRWPLLMSASYPKGRLQPYVIGGPAWAFTLEGDEVDVVLGGKVALSPCSPSTATPSSRISSSPTGSSRTGPISPTTT